MSDEKLKKEVTKERRKLVVRRLAALQVLPSSKFHNWEQGYIAALVDTDEDREDMAIKFLQKAAHTDAAAASWLSQLLPAEDNR